MREHAELKLGTPSGLAMIDHILAARPERAERFQGGAVVDRRAKIKGWARLIRESNSPSVTSVIVSGLLGQSRAMFSRQLRGNSWPSASAQAIALDLWGVPVLGLDPGYSGGKQPGYSGAKS